METDAQNLILSFAVGVRGKMTESFIEQMGYLIDEDYLVKES